MDGSGIRPLARRAAIGWGHGDNLGPAAGGAAAPPVEGRGFSARPCILDLGYSLGALFVRAELLPGKVPTRGGRPAPAAAPSSCAPWDLESVGSLSRCRSPLVHLEQLPERRGL